MAVARSAGVKDVAAAAGVSLGTVSNVLNRPERVSARTRDRVEQVMRELGFVRNESARQLRAGRSRTLAYVMLDATNPFFTEVAQGIEETAEDEDLSVFLCNSNNRAEREAAYLERLEQQRVQGIVLTPVDPWNPRLAELSGRGTPVVLLDRVRDGDDFCSVSVDDVLGGRLAAEHLSDRGHERIGFVGGPETHGQVRDRLRGAREAWVEAGHEPQSLVEIETTVLTVAEGQEAAERLVALPPVSRPTAVFCANDLVALGLLQRCISLGLRLPEELGIVGYDDIDFASAAAVPLTSVRQPHLALGRAAAELLLDEVTNSDHEHQHRVLVPELVARASTPRSGD